MMMVGRPDESYMGTQIGPFIYTLQRVVIQQFTSGLRRTIKRRWGYRRK
jgi:hypothetical protein